MIEHLGSVHSLTSGKELVWVVGGWRPGEGRGACHDRWSLLEAC